MPFRFSWSSFATDAAVLLTLSFRFPVTAQNLDWSNDVTVFGTAADERAPVLVASPSGGRLRAFCVTDDSCLHMKVSGDNGASWSVSSDSTFSSTAVRVHGASDATFHYVMVGSEASSRRALFRFEPAANSFRSAWMTMIAPTRTAPVLCFDMMTDVVYEPADAYLNLCWIEQTAARLRTLCFTQSRDRAVNFDSAREIMSFDADTGSLTGVSLTAAWGDDDELLWIACAMDRPGSIPEEIRLFRSSSQGVMWEPKGPVDSAAVSQTEPSLAAYGVMILLAYSYAALPGARDVRMVYSVDGGETFALPQVMAGSEADEYSPHLLIDFEGISFSLLYLSGRAGSDSATVMLRTGSLATPWEIGPEVALCDVNSLPANEIYSATASLRGSSAVWSSRFVTGDCDVRFDASWRGSVTGERPLATPREAALESVCPNPFNSSTTVLLRADHTARLTLGVYDLLGRAVRGMECSIPTAGEQRLLVNFDGLGSGTYFLRLENSPAPPLKLLLVR
jgi:hypothetical protein